MRLYSEDQIKNVHDTGSIYTEKSKTIWVNFLPIRSYPRTVSETPYLYFDCRYRKTLFSLSRYSHADTLWKVSLKSECPGGVDSILRDCAGKKWILLFTVYWSKYGTNSLIWLVERQSVHRRTDRRMDRAMH